MTHAVAIHQNRICDRDNEFFYVDLTVNSGTFPILLSPSSAQVFIADTTETECGKAKYSLLCYWKEQTLPQ